MPHLRPPALDLSTFSEVGHRLVRKFQNIGVEHNTLRMRSSGLQLAVLFSAGSMLSAGRGFAATMWRALVVAA